jgi:hypothetical protein
MSSNWDLVAYNRNKQMTLIAEFKSAQEIDAKWVTEYRDNLLTYADLPSVPFFLVAMPEKGYLWHNNNQENNIPPTHIINLIPILKSHSQQRLNKTNLEMFFTAWLFQRIHQPIEEIPTEERWIIDTGLYEAIKGGIIEEDGLLWQ